MKYCRGLHMFDVILINVIDYRWNISVGIYEVELGEDIPGNHLRWSGLAMFIHEISLFISMLDTILMESVTNMPILYIYLKTHIPM